MPNYHDEQLNFRQGGDSGQDDADSIQPIDNAETIWEEVDNRPVENLRKRIEVVRSAVEHLNYQADYDRQLLLRSGATFTLTNASGNYTLTQTGDDLWVYPALTPGRDSGGRAKGAQLHVNGVAYAGTATVNDLVLTASSDYTGQRGYADGTTFEGASPAVTLGANGIVVSLVADAAVTGGIGTIVALVDGSPVRKVTLTYGTATSTTTLKNVIDFINADATSQGGVYGLQHLFRASTTVADGGLVVAPPALTDGVFQGGYDAEAHKVTVAQMTAFFAVSANRLQEGEGLAIAYPSGPVETGAGGDGGRRQSLWDLPLDRTGTQASNVTASVGYNLFNTGREPAKIPGSIPIGKLLEGEFVFCDGTRVPVGTTVSLGESATTIGRLGATNPAGVMGADLVGFTMSGVAWNGDSPADVADGSNVADVLDDIVRELAAEAANDSGSRRVGAEPVTGSATVGNTATSLVAGSIREQLLALLEAQNRRVSENGHQLHTVNPLFKDLGTEGSGANLLLTLGTTTGDFANATPASSIGTALIHAQPMTYTISGANYLDLTEPCVYGSAVDTIALSGADLATRFTGMLSIQTALLVPKTTPYFSGGTSQTSYVTMAKITGATGGTDNDGYYFVHGHDAAGYEITLRKLTGAAPDFSTTTFTSATVTFLSTLIVGSDALGQKIRSLHAGNSPFLSLGIVSQTTPVMEVFVPDDDPTNDPIKSVIFTPRALVITGTDAIPRSSTNWFTGGDKALLDGVETGVVVDATLGHHHGGAYSLTSFLDVPVVVRTAVALSTIDAYADANALITTEAPPTGYTVLAAIVNVTVDLRVSGTPVSGSAIKSLFAFRKSGGGTEFTIRPMYITPGGTPAAWLMDYQLTIPVDASLQFQVMNNTGANLNIDTATSLIDILQVGYVLRRT
jgi:hypothetical protein